MDVTTDDENFNSCVFYFNIQILNYKTQDTILTQVRTVCIHC